MVGTLAPKLYHSLAKSLTKIHSSVKLSGALLTEDSQTAKTGIGSSWKPQMYGERQNQARSPKSTGKNRNTVLVPLGANQINEVNSP